eukprot:4511030-Amphidinium_carterae.2
MEKSMSEPSEFQSGFKPFPIPSDRGVLCARGPRQQNTDKRPDQRPRSVGLTHVAQQVGQSVRPKHCARDLVGKHGNAVAMQAILQKDEQQAQ